MMYASFLQDLSLWGCFLQSMIFIVLGLMASTFLRRRPSRAYQVLLCTMMAAAIVPLMSAVVKHFDLGVFTVNTTTLSSALLEAPRAIPLAGNDGTDDLAAIPVPMAVSTTGVYSERVKTTSAWHSVSWHAVAARTWVIATFALLARLVVTFIYGAYIVRNAQRSGCEQVQQAVEDVTSKLGISSGLQVRGSGHIRSPIVWCWSHPPIMLVPDVCEDPRVDWAGVVAHELAHCKRRDHITGLMAELMVCLLPWNPMMWLSRRCLVNLGEQACDDWVVATGQPSEDYAESLLRFSPQGQMPFLPAVVHSKRGLAGRVNRILQNGCGNPRTGAVWAFAVSVVVACLSVGIAFAQTQTRPEKPQNPMAYFDTGQPGVRDTHKDISEQHAALWIVRRSSFLPISDTSMVPQDFQDRANAYNNEMSDRLKSATAPLLLSASLSVLDRLHPLQVTRCKSARLFPKQDGYLNPHFQRSWREYCLYLSSLLNYCAKGRPDVRTFVDKNGLRMESSNKSGPWVISDIHELPEEIVNAIVEWKAVLAKISNSLLKAPANFNDLTPEQSVHDLRMIDQAFQKALTDFLPRFMSSEEFIIMPTGIESWFETRSKARLALYVTKEEWISAAWTSHDDLRDEQQFAHYLKRAGLRGRWILAQRTIEDKASGLAEFIEDVMKKAFR